jgi:hypothetical protein
MRDELEFAGTHHAFGLPGVARTNDGAGDGGQSQRPSDGGLARSAPVVCGNFFQPVDEFEIFRKIGFAELRAVLPLVGKLCSALTRHCAGQQT